MTSRAKIEGVVATATLPLGHARRLRWVELAGICPDLEAVAIRMRDGPRLWYSPGSRACPGWQHTRMQALDSCRPTAHKLSIPGFARCRLSPSRDRNGTAFVRGTGGCSLVRARFVSVCAGPLVSRTSASLATAPSAVPPTIARPREGKNRNKKCLLSILRMRSPCTPVYNVSLPSLEGGLGGRGCVVLYGTRPGVCAASTTVMILRVFEVRFLDPPPAYFLPNLSRVIIIVIIVLLRHQSVGGLLGGDWCRIAVGCWSGKKSPPCRDWNRNAEGRPLHLLFPLLLFPSPTLSLNQPHKLRYPTSQELGLSHWLRIASLFPIPIPRSDSNDGRLAITACSVVPNLAQTHGSFQNLSFPPRFYLETCPLPANLAP